MKIFIFIDLEGVTGVVSIEHHAHPGSSGYQEARRLLMSDVNSSIIGAVEGGVDEVSIYDMHYYGLNVILEELHPKAKIIMGKPQGLFLDETYSGIFLIGFHSRAGTKGGILTHTYTSAIESIHLNDRLVGEIEMEAALGGEFGVPVIMVSGDSKAIEQAKESLGDIEYAVVKESISENSAFCFPPAMTGKLIREKAGKAVTRIGEIKPFVIKHPVELRIRYHDFKRVPSISGMEKEGVKTKKIDRKTLLIKGKSLRTIWHNYKSYLLGEG